MTMGQCSALNPDFQWPTVLECDLVIMDAGSAKDFHGDLPAPDGESLAPIILLGVSGFLLLARDAWQVLPQLNPDEKDLRLAVQTSLEQAAMLRHAPEAGQDREDFLSFLGHEMRSPLTAAKTALEVLQGDLGGLQTQEGPPDPHLKMLDIALRNVRRLHHTVEWSQELMASSPVQQNIHLQDVEGRKLAEGLGKNIVSQWACETLDLQVHTDADSLCTLVNQVARAMNYAIPHCQLELNALCSTEQKGALSLTLSPARGSVQDGAPRISRLGLSSGPEGSSAESELHRLIGFVVSGVLVSRLGVELEVYSGQDEELTVKIRVPGVLSGELLTPA